MKACVAIVLSLLCAACGDNASTPAAPSKTVTPAPVAPAPLAPAAFATPPGAVLSLPGCAALAQLNFGVGISVTTCRSFSAPLVNTGKGCASGVHGTMTVSNPGGQQVGSAAWTYANKVQAGEQFIYSGGSIQVPSSLQFTTTFTVLWTNVSC